MTEKSLLQQTLTWEHDRNSQHRQTLTLPMDRKLALVGTPAQPLFAPLQEKNQALWLGGPRMQG